MSESRQRPHFKGPRWIIILVTFVSFVLIVAYMSPPKNSVACYMFSSPSCALYQQFSFIPSRELTDDETATQVVIKEVLEAPFPHSKKPKIAFMFLIPESLPFEPLWDNFFRGHEGKFSVYVHASKEMPKLTTRYFVGREIHGGKVGSGQVAMIDAERSLLTHALVDPDNHRFVLLSDSCIPLYNFNHVYNYLIHSNLSYTDCFFDPGPHGNGRFSEHMLPEVQREDFRKGSQWFSMTRKHAIIVLADSLYYKKFKLYCRPNMDGRNCFSEEHYFPTLFNMVDPTGIANWSVTHADWSEGKSHPKAYGLKDVSPRLIRKIKSVDMSVHVTSDKQREVTSSPCLWNGRKQPCFLFARKFNPETLQRLLRLFSNYTTV